VLAFKTGKEVRPLSRNHFALGQLRHRFRIRVLMEQMYSFTIHKVQMKRLVLLYFYATANRETTRRIAALV
jgi:hypothetical protein